MTNDFLVRGAAGFFTSPFVYCAMGLRPDSCLLAWQSSGNPMVLVYSEKGSVGSEAGPFFTVVVGLEILVFQKGNTNLLYTKNVTKSDLNDHRLP